MFGNDFVYELSSILDLLWPIVVLMVKEQLQWLYRWKFAVFIDAALQRINLFSEEIMNETPCVTARNPRLNMYTQDIENFNFKSVKLVEGWIAKP